MPDITIRPASRADAALIHHLIVELAIYERAEDQVAASPADIERSLFADDAVAQGLICCLDGQPVGFAVYFFNYSTWLGKPGLYLEDLYVSPEHRGSGAGTALLKHLAQIACERQCGRFEWSVIDWNAPAIRFYESIGAAAQPEWVRYRMAGDALTRFAEA